MPRGGLSMRSVREILRLRLELGLSMREVANSCSVHHKTVSEYERRISEVGLTWADIKDMDDDVLKELVRVSLDKTEPERPLPPLEYITKELKRPHVTRRTLWFEYKAQYPDGYEYSQFCYHISKLLVDPELTMHIEYKAGERLFTDYAGDTMPITDIKTGEIKPAYVFVSCLGSSSLIYTEGTENMQEANWISSHIRALEFYGGSPEVIVPDNTKTAVKTPDRYEPDINPIFHDMASHYGCAVIPARVRKPKDKARVEKSVQVVETMILGPLRNRVFFSIHELNAALWEGLERVNAQKMQRLGVSRRELYEEIEKSALIPLPETRYAFREWANAKVGYNYHIWFGKHYYSVPYRHAGKEIDVKASSTLVEILYDNKRIASHPRSYQIGGYTTVSEHMPPAHRAYGDKWPPERLISWAATVGPNTRDLVRIILEKAIHPQQRYNSCSGIIKLESSFGKERLEMAARRAVLCNATNYKSVKSILDKGLDKEPIREMPLYVPDDHENIRGGGYYS
ncbi:MAG: IS21 family transposase [Armatimonadota bacterium]